MTFLRKKYAYALLFSILLVGSFSYSLLKTFLIPEKIASVATNTTSSNQPTDTQATKTDTSYKDDNIDIQLTEKTVHQTQVYIAEVTTTSSDFLKTAFAQNSYGTNVTAKTSQTAQDNQAILAINGDYYGANANGYVIRNGVVYRDTVRDNSENGDLAIYKDGSWGIVYENQISAQELVKQGVQNLLTFGPALVKDGEIAVSTNSEVGQAMSSNPRTAIGIIDENHYIILVSDGRTSESAGLTLYDVAEIMHSYGVQTAYNLDGGGSSTLYFNGEIINKPTTNGNTISERAVSDIVYIGY